MNEQKVAHQADYRTYEGTKISETFVSGSNFNPESLVALRDALINSKLQKPSPELVQFLLQKYEVTDAIEKLRIAHPIMKAVTHVARRNAGLNRDQFLQSISYDGFQIKMPDGSDSYAGSFQEAVLGVKWNHKARRYPLLTRTDNVANLPEILTASVVVAALMVAFCFANPGAITTLLGLAKTVTVSKVALSTAASVGGLYTVWGQFCTDEDSLLTNLCIQYLCSKEGASAYYTTYNSAPVLVLNPRCDTDVLAAATLAVRGWIVVDQACQPIANYVFKDLVGELKTLPDICGKDIDPAHTAYIRDLVGVKR